MGSASRHSGQLAKADQREGRYPAAGPVKVSRVVRGRLMYEYVPAHTADPEMCPGTFDTGLLSDWQRR